MADFKIEIPISVKGKGEGKKVGEDIATAISNKIKSLFPKGAVPGKGGGKVGGLATEAAGDVASAAAQNAKGLKEVVGSVGKTGAIMAAVGVAVGAIALAVEAISEFLKPIFSLFKVILMLLFLPLIPILKPVMKGLGEMAKRLAPIMIGLSKKIEKIISPRMEKIVDLIVNAVVNNVDSFVKVIEGFLSIFEVFAPLLDLALNTILAIQQFFIDNGAVLFQIILDILSWVAQFLEPVWDIIKKALEEAGNFLADRWDNILNILERTADLLESVFDKISKVGGGVKGAVKTTLGVTQSIVDLLFGNRESDFISRPGQSPVSFSPDDTIIGIKDPSKLGGGSNVITINIIKPSVRSGSDIKQIANEVSRVLQRQMTGRISSA